MNTRILRNKAVPDADKWRPILSKAARMLSQKPCPISERYAELAVRRCGIPPSQAINYISDRVTGTDVRKVHVGAMLNNIRLGIFLDRHVRCGI